MAAILGRLAWESVFRKSSCGAMIGSSTFRTRLATHAILSNTVKPMFKALRVLALSLLLGAPAMAQNAGPNNVTPVDCSGAISVAATAQNAFTPQGNIRGFIIQNLSTDPMWISWTGTAVVGQQGSYLLQAGSPTVQGGTFTSPFGFGINKALSVIAATLGDKYSCTLY